MIEDREEITARLLQLAGPRPDAPDDRAARVRSAVHAQWRHHVRRRRVRGRLGRGTLALAAVAAIVLVVTRWPAREPGAPAAVEPVAVVELVEGRTTLSHGDSLPAGHWIETDGTARLAARLTTGVSTRLDINTRARLLSSSVIELTAGAVYLDTNDTETPLEIRTPLGVAHDIGTQFEVRLETGALEVRVRTGLVEVRAGGAAIAARPGTELRLDGGRAVTRPIAAFGPEWQWIGRLAPPFEIEGRPLAAFLDHLSREHGWTVRYADARLGREASGIILHGSVSGLPPQDALAVAMTISGLSYRLVDGDVVVTRAPGRE